MDRAGAAAAVLLLLLVIPGLQPGGLASQPEPKSVFQVTSYDGNLSDGTVELGPGVSDRTLSITLPSNAEVVNASLELTPLPFSPGGHDYPAGPALDIGGDGRTDWAFDGFGYGEMGHQRLFHDGTETATGYNLTLGSGEQVIPLTRLAADASIISASMNLGGWPSPFWRDPMKVTKSGGSPGENSPVFFTAPDRLWVAWASKDPRLVDGSDWDIVVSWSFDGTGWADPVDISPPGDLYEDDSPDIMSYDGRIFVAWSAAHNESQFSNSHIFIRSWDGARWDDPVRLTPPGLNHLNDWPQMEVYGGLLFVFWRTTDPALAEIDPDGGDMDIIYRTFDGAAWGYTVEVTPGWSTEIDWSLNIVRFDGKLFLFWDMDTDLTDGFTVDIFYRYFDGDRWSDAYNIIPQPDYELDEIPKAAVYRNPVTGKDELWVSWIRGSPSAHDLDIMVRRYDGTSWGPLTELTTPGEVKDNMGQEILEYDHRLYVVWVTGTNTTTETNETIAIYNTYGDVVIRAWDGFRWSELMELTPGEENDNANSPTLAVYNGKLYCGWAYPYKPATPGGTETWDIIARNIDFRPVELELDVGNDLQADWGPSEITSTNQNIPIYTDVLQQSLAGAARKPDAFGNEMCDIGLRLRSIYPCEVQMRNLSIIYSLTVRLDNITATLNELLRASTGRGRAGGNVTIPLLFNATSPGRMRVHDLNITYIINLPPVLLEDIPDNHFPEDSAAVRLIDLEQYFWDDWDDGRLRFEVTFESDPGHIRAALDGSFLSFTAPTRYWHGTAWFRVRALDRAGLWAPGNLFNITVDHVNHPPVLDPIPDQKVDLGDRVYFEARASDPDNDTLSFLSDDLRFSLLPLERDANGAYVQAVPKRPGRFYLNVTVEDGQGGNATALVRIDVRDKVSSATNDLCATWLVIVFLAAAAGGAAEWYRRKYLKETGPVLGPGGEFTEEEAFGGRMSVIRGNADVAGGSEQENPARAGAPARHVLSRRELWELRRKQAEERIRIPDKAVSADRAEEELEEELREKATRPGRSILPSAEGELKPVPPAEKDPLAEMLKEE